MKIIKIADAFQSEGHDPMENIEERDRFEAEQKLNEDEINKRGPFYTADVLKEISKVLPNKITSWYVAGGSVGWFKFTDGKIYEVTVSPAAYGHHYNILKNQENEKSDENL